MYWVLVFVQKSFGDVYEQLVSHWTLEVFNLLPYHSRSSCAQPEGLDFGFRVQKWGLNLRV